MRFRSVAISVGLAVAVAVGAASPVTAATTHHGPAPRPKAVTKAGARSWTSTSVGLHWVNPRAATFRAVVVRVKRGHAPPGGPHGGTSVGVTHGNELVAHGLRPHTGYTFALFSRNSAGRYSRATVVRAITSPAPVGAVRTSVSDAAAALAWTNPSASTFHGIVVRYRRGSVAPTSVVAGAAARVASSSSHSVSVSGLMPDTTYTASLWTYDGKHHYSSPAHARFRTRPAPGPVSLPRAMIQAVSAAGVTQVLTWSAPRSPDLAGVLVRRTSGSRAPTLTSGTLIADVPAGTSSLRDRPSAVGTYTYALFSHDSSGHRSAPAVLTVSTDKYSTTAPAIQGRVTTASGVGVAGASVTGTPVDDDPAWASTARTDSAGYYTLAAGIFAGSSYRVCVQTPQTATTLVRTVCRAVDVVPGVVAATRGVDMVLVSGGHIAGQVTGQDRPVPGAGIVVLDPADDSGTPVATTVTSSDGTYDVGRLAPGNYAVCVDTTGVSAPGYVSACRGGKVWRPGQPSPAGIIEVGVRAGAGTVTNLRLSPAGAIAGTVRSESTALGGVTVTVRDPDDQSVVASAITSADGGYEIGSLAPTSDGYLVCFDASALVDQAMRSECWRDAPWNRYLVPAETQTVATASGNVVEGIDADLAAGATIEGMVTAASTGRPLSGVSVQAFDTTTADLIGDATTDDRGSYVIGSLAPAAEVTVCADASAAIGSQPDNGYLDRCLGPNGASVIWAPGARPSADAYRFALPAGADVAGTDLALPDGNVMAGAVRNSAGVGVAGVRVYAIGLFPERVLGAATSAVDGSYRITGLEASTVFVCVRAALTALGRPTGYADQCLQGQFWSGEFKTTPPGLAGVVVPTSGPVDVRLVRFASITGTITTGANQTPVVGATVSVLQTTGEAASPPTVSAADGSYTVSRLPAGTYRVCVDGTDATTGSAGFGYARECFGNIAWNGTDLPRGPSVTVTAGSRAGPVNVSLVADGRITGRVLASNDHAAVSKVDVLAYDSAGQIAASAVSSSSGAYSVTGLDPHFAYSVCFDPVDAVTAQGARISVRGQCAEGRSWTGADQDPPPTSAAVKPLAGATVRLADTVLTRAGSVAGTVVSGVSGRGLGGVMVYAFNANGDEVAQTSSDPNGGYYLRGFGGAPRGYRVCAYAPTVTGSEPQLLSLCYHDTDWDGGFSIPATATALSAPAASPRTGVDLVLPGATTVTGTVADATGAPIGDALAEIFDNTGNLIGEDFTSGDGRYELEVPDRATAAYRLCVDPVYATTGTYSPRCYVDAPWSGDAATLPQDATVLPPPGADGNVAGVDIRLDG